MEIYFATTNKGKFVTVKKELEEFGINLKWFNKNLKEIQSDHIEEIAKRKCLEAYESLNKPVIAIDAGLYINSLKGFPGPYTSYVLKTIGINGILALLKHENDRSCYFYDVLAYYDEYLTEPIIFSHKLEGELARVPRGKKSDWWWSDLFYIFKPNINRSANKTLGEMSLEEWKELKEKTKLKEIFCYHKFAKWIIRNKKNKRN